MTGIDEIFEELMERVGYTGRFQTTYKWIYVTGVTFFGSMLYMNLILALNVPDYWCSVPGMEQNNLTIDEWRRKTLPIESDNRGISKHSSCKMYNANFSAMSHFEITNFNSSQHEVIDCAHEFEYDRQWYDQTIVTQENWVCEKDLYIANTFVASRIAEVVGAFIFGQLGDMLGRKIVYYISVVFVIIGRVMSIVTTSSYIWFILFASLAGLTTTSIFQSPLIVALEISREDARTSIAMWQSIGWSIGTCLMPLVFWWLRDWEPFMWMTSVSVALTFVFHRYMIESPRWLLSKRRFPEMLKQFKTIARINRREFKMSEDEVIEMCATVKEEKVYGIASLFTSWRIARTTVIMAFSWCVVCVSYFTLVLFSSRMGGNPFINLLFQSAVEIPAYVIGKCMSDRIGRRLTNCFSYMTAAAACLIGISFAQDPKYEIVMVGLVTFIKFLNGITFFAVGLQSMETYPTCLRQTGLSLGAMSGNAVSIIAPYFVFLGTNYDIRYPYYILLVLFFLGGFTGLYLPETLYEKLPDTLEDAKRFGEKQKFWSLPKQPVKINVDDSTNEAEKTKMNQKIYVP